MLASRYDFVVIVRPDLYSSPRERIDFRALLSMPPGAAGGRTPPPAAGEYVAVPACADTMDGLRDQVAAGPLGLMRRYVSLFPDNVCASSTSPIAEVRHYAHVKQMGLRVARFWWEFGTLNVRDRPADQRLWISRSQCERPDEFACDAAARLPRARVSGMTEGS